jgi:hypothetical protein
MALVSVQALLGRGGAMKKRKEPIIIEGDIRGTKYRLEDYGKTTTVFLHLDGAWREMSDDTFPYQMNPELFMQHLSNLVTFMTYKPRTMQQVSLFDEVVR